MKIVDMWWLQAKVSSEVMQNMDSKALALFNVQSIL